MLQIKKELLIKLIVFRVITKIMNTRMTSIAIIIIVMRTVIIVITLGIIKKNNDVNNNNHNNNKRPEFTGSIINRTGNKIHFPGTLKKKQCTNFADTEETCNRGNTCLFDHALFLSGYHEDDIAPMVNFIDEHKDLAWYSNVTVPVNARK